MGGQTQGDIVADRLKQRLKTLGIPVDHRLQRNVLERAVYQVQSEER